MSFTNEQKEAIKVDYINYLLKLDSNSIVYSENKFIFWTKNKVTAYQMINELNNNTKFSKQIIYNILVNRVCEVY